MADVSSDSILETAIEVNDLVQCPEILAHFQGHIRAWCEREEEREAERRKEEGETLPKLKRKLVKKLEKGGNPEPLLYEIDRRSHIGHGPDRSSTQAKVGPGPLFLSSVDEFQICDAYVMTAIAHDLLIEEVHSEVARPPEIIYPGGREFALFYVCIHETDAQKETQAKKQELRVRPLRQSLAMVKTDLCSVGLLKSEPVSMVHEDSSEQIPAKRKPPSDAKAMDERWQREKEIADRWERSHESNGTHKADWVREYNVGKAKCEQLTVAELDLILGRVRKRRIRNSRADKHHGQRKKTVR